MILSGNPAAPLYRRVYDTVRGAILDGSLAAGARIPGTRSLARDLGVSRIVVLAAFEQLAAEGYVEATRGSGTRVAVASDSVRTDSRRAQPVASERTAGPVSRYASRARSMAPDATPARTAVKAKIDFGYTSTEVDERTLTRWRQALSGAVAEAAQGYPDASGLLRLRTVLAQYLRQERGVEAQPEQLLIVSGSQQALDLTARVICDAGTVVGIEDPHYQGTRAVFAAAGARLAACDIDEDGFAVKRHAKRLARAAAICVTPSHQFPTGAIMPIERRWNLLQWAEKQRAWIVEDDYDCEFRYGVGAVPALQGLDANGRVIYIGTFARTLFPSLRLGYVVAPPALLDAFRAVKWLADRGSPLTAQYALATMMESGTYERARRRMARRLAEKRRTLLAALQSRFSEEDVAVSGSSSGTHVYLRFPALEANTAQALVEGALRRGVRVYDARPYHVKAPRDARLIVGYTTVAEPDIEPGIAILADSYRRLKTRSRRTT